MNRTDRQFKERLRLQENALSPPHRREHLQEVVRSAKAAFHEGESDDILTGAEFLYQQAGYIRKRWWVLQGMVLVALWMLIRYMEGNSYEQRIMGVAAPLFGVLLLPELWKNREMNAMEVEGAAFYSLRQIYAARLFAFAMVDVLMLTAFCLVNVGSGQLMLEEIMLQFFLPLTVTCCICFRTLYSRRACPEVFAVILCLLWSGIWLQVALLGKLYDRVSVPVWYGVLVTAFCYLLYCIYRGQRNCRAVLEETER